MRCNGYRLLACFFVVAFLCTYKSVKSQVAAGINVNGNFVPSGDTVKSCAGNTVTFVHSSLGATAINWEFPGSSVPTSSSFGIIPVIYSANGIFKVKQVVSNANSSDSSFVYIDVSDIKPFADFIFTPNNECGNVPVQFTNLSSGTNLTKSEWDFGDGEKSTVFSPSHQFLNAIGAPGTQTYNVSLTTYNNYGCTAVKTNAVTVRKIPDASIGNADPGVQTGIFNNIPTFRRCTNQPFYQFKFINATTTPSLVTEYTIQWGDGSPDSVFTTWPAGSIINHTYPLGNTVITILAMGTDGCIGIKKYNVFLGTTPAGGITSPGNTAICAPQALTFFLNGISNNSPGTVYTLTFNDGTLPLVFQHPAPPSVVHDFLFSSCGTTSNSYNNSFSANLVVENACGTTTGSVIPIYVSAKPRSSINLKPDSIVCTGTNVLISNDNVRGGVVNYLGGTSSECVTPKLVWSILPATGWTLTSGIMGSTNASNNILLWTGGSSTIGVTFNEEGVYEIQLLSGNACGTDTVRKKICVRKPPVASFTMDNRKACTQGTALFTNTTPAGACYGNKYEWEVQYIDDLGCGSATNSYQFINGTTSTSFSPQIQFNSPGKYAVKLHAFINSLVNSCPSTPAIDTFYVSGKPKVTINPVSPICINNTISPTATVSACYSSAAPTYLWNFSNGTPATSTALIPPPVLYTTLGAHPITFEVTNECGSTIASTVATIVSQVSADAGVDTSVCAGSIAFSLSGIPMGGTWSGDPQVTAGGIFTPTTPGTYTLTYTYSGGTCTASDVKQITVLPGLTNNLISASQAICEGDAPQTITGSVPAGGDGNYTYVWQSSADNLTWTTIAGATGIDYLPPVTDSTTYYRRLVNTSQCANNTSPSVEIKINLPAKAEFSTPRNSGCVPFAIDTLIKTTRYPNRNAVYNWYADDVLIGSNNTGDFPGYTITVPLSSVVIKLVTTSLSGCKNDSMQITFSGVGGTAPSFTQNNTAGCGPLTVTFTNTTPDSDKYTFIWDFGNGTTSTDTHPGPITFQPHPLQLDTTYKITLKSPGSCDLADAVKYVTVQSPPKALFTPDKSEGCSPMKVTFSNTSGGKDNNYVWDFGDGSAPVASNAMQLEHTYTVVNKDTFYVKLKAVNGCGADSLIYAIVVNPNNIRLDFAINGNDRFGCLPHTVRFINNSTGGNIYNWDFGDGATITTTKGVDTITHTYTQAGNFTISVLANSSCTNASDNELVTVQPRPIVNFTAAPLTACNTDTIRFLNQSDAGINYLWKFGDGNTSVLQNPAYAYQQPNTYRVWLTGTKVYAPGNSCSDSTYKDVVINGAAGTLRYNSGYVCSNEALKLEVISTNASQFKYMFGDGDSLITNSSTVFHKYTKPGTYVPYVFLSTLNCPDKISKGDTIRVDSVKAGFTYTQLKNCGSTIVKFADTSYSFFGKKSWLWSFGDGTTSTLQHPEKIFTQTGEYLVRLFVTGISNCVDTLSYQLPVSVYDQPVSSILSDSISCTGYQVALSAVVQSSDNIAAYQWNFGNNATATGRNVSVTYSQANAYTVRLISRTVQGCADTAYRIIIVRASPFVNAGNDVRICQGQSVQLSVNGADSYNWYPVQGLSCFNCANPAASPAVTTNYVVQGTNAAGCKSNDSITVNVSPPIDVSVSGKNNICLGESTQLLASGGYKYSWSPAIGLNKTDIPNPVASPAYTVPYRVIGFDEFNCFADTAFITVGVGRTPVVDLGNGGTVVAGTPVSLNPVITGSSISKYVWTPPSGLSCINCPKPVATVNNDIIYKLEVEDIYGCKGNDTINFKVICQATQVFVPNAFSPDGDGVNDILLVRGKGISAVKYFRIFNRWGQVVFERSNIQVNDITQGWDGKVNGIPAQPDVYVYTAEVICTAGSSFIYKGNVTLIR